MKSLFLALSLVSGIAGAAVVEPKSGALSFKATASPGALSISGKGAAPRGQLELAEKGEKLEASGTLKLDISSLVTGISLRDRHMKDKYLEAGKFPEAQLTLSKQGLPKHGMGPFEGELEFHGVKHKVSGQAEIVAGAGGARSVKASFPVSLHDHGITAPSFAGISVADQVQVETELQLGAATP